MIVSQRGSYFYRETRGLAETRWLRAGEVEITEHGLRASYRYVGYDGIARNSDRVSMKYFSTIISSVNLIRLVS